MQQHIFLFLEECMTKKARAILRIARHIVSGGSKKVERSEHGRRSVPEKYGHELHHFRRMSDWQISVHFMRVPKQVQCAAEQNSWKKCHFSTVVFRLDFATLLSQWNKRRSTTAEDKTHLDKLVKKETHKEKKFGGSCVAVSEELQHYKIPLPRNEIRLATRIGLWGI
ncbi:hypothetical protein CDAR_546321 [Caerostris darwini]|uniref:Uncharacterized protein n=1 Tax=Caerostris darwini TaxID=1538125 RepID=A0AAV4RN39_9ARAC|nr:hypothetical protein CDAR_546321 [Caerostris darwini]